VAAVCADGDATHARNPVFRAHQPVAGKAAPAPAPVYGPAPTTTQAPPPPPPPPVYTTPAPPPPPPVYTTPAPPPPPVYKPVPAPAPVYGPAPAPEPFAVPNYDFSYAVLGDAPHGNANFGHNENRNDAKTTGQYRVVLPDGRTQVVTYTVNDANSGYIADVKYEGPIAVAPVPTYGPA